MGMRTLSALVAAILLASPTLALDEAEQGRVVAETWCASCHAVGTAQDTAIAGVPSFRSIGARDDLDADGLTVYLADPHPPMPDLSLSRDQIDALVVYMSSLTD